MKITNFDRPSMSLVRNELDKAVAEVANKLGISIEIGNGRFSSDNAHFKIILNTVSKDGSVKTQEAKAWSIYAVSQGLKESDLGEKFKNGRDWFEIIGYNVRAPKFPINAKRVKDGVEFKFPVSAVKSALKRK